ncbi:MAG: hypothetical protein WCP86_01685, partial [bacterium]
FGPVTNEVFGLPRHIEEAFPAYDLQAPGPCKNCGKVHETDRSLTMSFSNTWIVAALSDEQAATRPLTKSTRAQSRAVWLIQIPMPKKPGSDDVGDKFR